jgi:FAD:protein FMN transferase
VRGLWRHQYEVMGTVFSFALARVPGRHLVREVESELDRIDRVFSTYRADSEISALGEGRRRLSSCSPDVQEVLARCADAALLTGGYFSALHSGRLDPTGLVKGWAVARVAALLADAGSTCHAVNGGGDVLATADPESDVPWRIGVSGGSTVVSAHQVAVATSGNVERPGSVVDPFTRQPALALRSVTVVGSDIVTADAVATAALAMGHDAFDWLSNLPGYDAVVVAADGSLSTARGRSGAVMTIGPARPATS